MTISLGRTLLPEHRCRPPAQARLGPQQARQLQIKQNRGQLLGGLAQGLADLLETGARPHRRQQAPPGRIHPRVFRGATLPRPAHDNPSACPGPGSRTGRRRCGSDGDRQRVLARGHACQTP